jgi:hypothetical protein
MGSPTMATKLAGFLATNKIDPRRLIAASRSIERLRPDDRAIRLARRRKGKEGGDAGEAPKGKPRSGRPVTARLISDASAGKAIAGPAKTRLLRAVNRILEQRKKDPVDLRTLF